MSYTSGMLNKRVTIMRRTDNGESKFGKNSAGAKWSDVLTVWANITWSRGAKALREGALDAYDSIMVRMRWNDIITRDDRIKYKDRIYGIDSLHASRGENTIQITCTELINP